MEERMNENFRKLREGYRAGFQRFETILDTEWDEYFQRIEQTLGGNTKRFKGNSNMRLEEKEIEPTKQIEEEIWKVREDGHEKWEKTGQQLINRININGYQNLNFKRIVSVEKQNMDKNLKEDLRKERRM